MGTQVAAERPRLPLLARVVAEAALLGVVAWGGLWGTVGPIVVACVLVDWWHHWATWWQCRIPVLGRAAGAAAAMLFLAVVVAVFLSMRP